MAENKVSESGMIKDPSASPLVTTLVFFNLETTGLSGEMKKCDVQITELSFIAVGREEFWTSKDLENIRIINKLSVCVKPRAPVSTKAAEISSLDKMKLKNEHPFDKGLALMIYSFLNRLPHPVCLLAHNGNLFDFPLLRAELKRLDQHLPDDLLCADTLLAFRELGPPCDDHESNETDPTEPKTRKTSGRTRFSSHSLRNLYTYFFKTNPPNEHQAEGDCKKLMMICSEMKERFLEWIDKNNRLLTSIPEMW